MRKLDIGNFVTLYSIRVLGLERYNLVFILNDNMFKLKLQDNAKFVSEQFTVLMPSKCHFD